MIRDRRRLYELSAPGKKDALLLMESKTKYFWLWLWYIRNKHPLWSVFFRDPGTNLTGMHRYTCFISSLLTVMAVQAIFYGQPGKKSRLGQVMTILYASLVSFVFRIPRDFLVLFFREVHWSHYF